MDDQEKKIEQEQPPQLSDEVIALGHATEALQQNEVVIFASEPCKVCEGEGCSICSQTGIIAAPLTLETLIELLDKAKGKSEKGHE